MRGYIVSGVGIFCQILSFAMVVTNLSAQNDKVAKWESEADTLMAHEDYQAALKLFNRIIDGTKPSDLQSSQLLYKRAVCLYSLDHFSAALTDVNQFIHHFPAFPQAKLLRAFIYRELGNTEGQLKSLDELLKLNPLNVELIKWQASLLIQEDQYDSAREKLNYAHSLKNDAEIELYLGVTYYYTDDPDSALSHFDNALQIKPDYLSALLYAGSLCLEESAYQLALSYLNSARSIDPENLSVLFYSGIALTELDRQKEGCRLLSKAFYGGEDDAAGYLKSYCFKGIL
jgi:tetratricopeptide (TPR) repeat protein